MTFRCTLGTVLSLFSSTMFRLTSIGMDDVLPKPFTRKSLLDMLEKHLPHLKRGAAVMEAPQSATAPSMTQSSAIHSLKDDSSPGQSPAASMGNWHSPTQFQGVSPIHGNVQAQYVSTGRDPSGYQTDQNGTQYQGPQTPINMPRAGPHRRQVSEMSGGADVTNYSKRQRMYGTVNNMTNTMQPGRPQ